VTVPVVALGERYVVGYNPLKFKDLLALSGEVRWTANPAELFAALDQLLGALEVAVLQIPADKLGYRSPDRDRDLQNFTVHTSHRVQRGLDSARTLRFGAPSNQIYVEAARPHDTPAKIAQYAADVRARLRAWRNEAGDAPLEQVVDAYNGQITLLQLFEMITNHTAHHLRQLYVFMQRLEIEPVQPLRVEQLRGVTVLENIF
jgi:uncharacterized damage-inducible protein DinB